MKKIFLIICLVLLFCNFVNAKENTIKTTKQEYLNQLNLIIEESNKALDFINSEYHKNYDKEIATRKKEIEKLENKMSDSISKHSICDFNTGMDEISKGPCGKYINKTTFFKGSSGLVYADSTYALNKCLEKSSKQSEAKGNNPCKKYMDAYNNAKKQIANIKKEIEKQYALLDENKSKQLETLAQDFKTKSNILYEDCKKTYPKKDAIFGYCNELSVKLEFKY